jgi:cation/acetate symporter
VEALGKSFIQAFGSVGSLGFVVMTFVVAAGTAASPMLLPRAGTTPGVYEARKSLGWAVLVTGFVLLTVPAIAIYLRALLLDQVIGHPGDRLPLWFQLLQQAGIAQIESKSQIVALGNVSFERDAVLFALPIAIGMPHVLIYLALTGAVAASLTALETGMAAIAVILSEDIGDPVAQQARPDTARTGTARVMVLGIGFVVTWLAIGVRADPLQLFLWAMTLLASAAFPVLMLAIWWDRMSAKGAMAGLGMGFIGSAAAILLSEAAGAALPSPLAGALWGLPLALVAAWMVSLGSQESESAASDVLEELRVPGGETVHDREMRLLRLKHRPPA